MPASPIRKLAPLAEAAKSRGTQCLSPQHRPAGHRDAGAACATGSQQLEDKVLEYSPSTGTPEFLRSLRQLLRAPRRRPLETRRRSWRRPAAARRSSSRSSPARTRRRRDRRRAVLRELPRLRDDGRAEHRRRSRAAGATGSTCRRARSSSARSRRARASSSLQSEQSDRHGLHARRAGDARRVLPRARAVPRSPTRSIASSSTTAARPISALELDGRRRFRDRRRQPLQALQRLRHPPRVARDAQSARSTTPACAWRRAASRLPASRSSSPSAPRASATSTRATSSPSTSAAATCSTKACTSIPGVFLRETGRRVLLHRALPVANAEDFAAWLLTDFEHDGATVMVAPASGFYASTSARARCASRTC